MTDKYNLNLVESNQIWVVIVRFRLIWLQTELENIFTRGYRFFFCFPSHILLTKRADLILSLLFSLIFPYNLPCVKGNEKDVEFLRRTLEMIFGDERTLRRTLGMNQDT